MTTETLPAVTTTPAHASDPALSWSFFAGAILRLHEAVDATARATVAATPEDRRDSIAHIDAAKVLVIGADFLAEAAHQIARGAPADCPEVSRYIRWGLWKAQEGAKLVSDAAKATEAGETGAGEVLQ